MEFGSILRNAAGEVELEKCAVNKEMAFLYSELLLAFYQNHVGLPTDGEQPWRSRGPG